MFATLLAAALALHPNSLSSSTITVRGAHVELAIRCQAASVLEVLGSAADPDHDDLLSQPELDAARGDFERYLLEHYRISVGGDDAAHATLLNGRLADLHPEPVDPFGDTQWIAATLAFESDKPVADLLIDDRIFQDAAPNHQDLCTVHFNDEPPGEAKFWAGETLRYYKPKAKSDAAPAAAEPTSPAQSFRASVPLIEWIRLGVEHILTGWDHIAFVIGLLVAAGSLSALLGVITAFTLAHSITLALSALDVVHVPPAPVEVLIGASIAWVGVANLLQRGAVARWKEAIGFGLVHGLGFASTLAVQLPPRDVIVPLLCFNVGVELGQLVIVVIALPLAWLAARELGAERYRRRAMPVVSVALAVLAVKWLIERAFAVSLFTFWGM